MTLIKMTTAANAYCDETYNTLLTMNYANEAISQINSELDCSLPFIESDIVEYVALSETWIRAILIPYICWSIKMNDGSLNEADRYQVKYIDGFNKLKLLKDTVIATEYQGENFSGVYEIDFSHVSKDGLYDESLEEVE
jgi:hypothetical protein